MEALGSPYKMIAADANNSGEISALDLVMLRKLILGTITEIDNNTSWRFVDADHSFVDPHDPFASVIPEEYVISTFDQSMAINFKAIKVGDVNNTVQANLGSDSEETSGKLTMKLDDRNVVAGELVELTFTAEEAQRMLGYQFTLNYDQSLLSYVGVQAEGLGISEENFGLNNKDAGMISTSWSNATPVEVMDNEELFTITFQAKKAGSLNGNVWIGSDMTRSESYDAEGNINEVDLVFEGSSSTVEAEFALMQNTPNPFEDETQIAFTLPENAEATVAVYDVAGKVLYKRTIDAVEGYNMLTIKADDLQGSGVMYYNVRTSEFSATRKMIMIR